MSTEIIFLAPLPSLGKRTRLTKMSSVMLSLNYRIRFFGWEREEGEINELGPTNDQITEIVLMRGGGYASTAARARYPLWMAKVFLQVLRLGRNKVIFCLGWESAFPAVIAAWFTGSRIVFDDADRFSMILRLPSIANRALQALERWTSRRSTLHIVPGFSRYDWQHEKMFVLRNCPLSTDYEKAALISLERPKGSLVLYANGWIGDTRGAPILLKLLNEADLHDLDLHLVLAGRIEGLNAAMLTKHSKVTFVGEVPQSNALAWYNVVDCVLTLYDPAVPINRKAESNKWGDAIFLGCPIIVNSEVETARELVDASVAFSFPYGGVTELIDLVSELIKRPEKIRRASLATEAVRPEYLEYDTQIKSILNRVLV